MRDHAAAGEPVAMTNPLRLRITVRGRLSTRLAAAFSGLRSVDRAGYTDLIGDAVDQAQVHGALNHVRDLGLSIDSIALERTPPEPDR